MKIVRNKSEDCIFTDIKIKEEVFKNLLNILILLLISSFVASAQLNFKIGYDAAYLKAENTNLLIDSYNDLNIDNLNDPVSSLHWVHGINMGLCYRANWWMIELSWESLGGNIKAIEVNGNNGVLKKAYLRLNHLSLSNEITNGILGLGASIDLSKYNIKSDLNGVDEKRILNESMPLTSKLFLAVYLKGSDYMSVAIKPYYRFQWGEDLSLQGLSQYLDLGNNFKEDSYNHFGISLSFYNGIQ